MTKEQYMTESAMVTAFGVTFNIYAAIIIGILILIIYAMWRANRSPDSDFDWSDMVIGIDQATGKRTASLSKILQIVGGITGTFIVIKLTLQNNITFDIFAAYLVYVASIEGFSKFMLARYGVVGQQDQNGNWNNSPGWRGGQWNNSPGWRGGQWNNGPGWNGGGGWNNGPGWNGGGGWNNGPPGNQGWSNNQLGPDPNEGGGPMPKPPQNADD